MPDRQRAEAAAAAQMIARMLMDVSEAIVPMREWLAGEERYFRSQGYSPDESRAMAAATYVTVFGSAISRSTPPESLPPS